MGLNNTVLKKASTANLQLPTPKRAVWELGLGSWELTGFRSLEEASMKANLFVALLLASTLTAGTAAAQPAPFNEIGLTMGHWHIVSKDV